MRCPNCAGEVQEGSRFCGLCGRTLAAPRPQAVSATAAASLSLFELPAARRGRTGRVALVLVLDAMLAGAGVYLTMAYLDAREAPAAVVASPSDAAPSGRI